MFSASIFKCQVSKGLRCSFSNLDFPSKPAQSVQSLATNCYSEKWIVVKSKDQIAALEKKMRSWCKNPEVSFLISKQQLSLLQTREKLHSKSRPGLFGWFRLYWEHQSRHPHTSKNQIAAPGELWGGQRDLREAVPWGIPVHLLCQCWYHTSSPAPRRRACGHPASQERQKITVSRASGCWNFYFQTAWTWEHGWSCFYDTLLSLIRQICILKSKISSTGRWYYFFSFWFAECFCK